MFVFYRNSYFPTCYAYSPTEREPRLLQKGYVTLSTAALCCGLVSPQWVLGALSKAGLDKQLVGPGGFGQGGPQEDQESRRVSCSVAKAIVWVFSALGHTHSLEQTAVWQLLQHGGLLCEEVGEGRSQEGLSHQVGVGYEVLVCKEQQHQRPGDPVCKKRGRLQHCTA